MLDSIPRRRLIFATAVLSAAGLLSATSCTQRGPSGGPALGGARISVMTSALSQQDITRVTLVVTGTNIAPPISVDLTRLEGSTQWAGSVPSIPAGRQHFAASAFSGVGAMPLYSGATDVTIVAGAKAQVVLVLQEANPASPLTHVAPVIDALTASRTVVGPSGAVDLSLTAHDRNTPSEPLTYAWTASCSPGPQSGAFNDAGSASVTWTAPATEGQSCELKVKVANVSTSREMSLTVTVPAAEGQGESDVVAFANTFPVIGSLVADFSSSAGRMQADLVLVATDPDGDPLRYSWASSCAGVFSFPVESSRPHVLFPVGVSDCVITAQVFDLCTGGNCGALADGGSSDGTDRGGVATAVVSTKGGAFSVSGVVTGPAAAGVTMTLTGADTAVTTTDAAGSFSFFGLADGAYTVTPSRAGYGFSPASAAVLVSGGSVANLSFASVAAAGFRGCKDVRQAGLPDGTYALDPDGLGHPVSVYCPASSENLAPVGLCQAEVGATPSCRSYVAAAGFDFAGVDFSKSLYYSNTTLALNGTVVPGNRDVILLGDGSLLTSTAEWDYLNRVTPDGTVTHFGGQITGAVGLSQLYDKDILVGLGNSIYNSGKTFSLEGSFQASVDSPTYIFTLAPSGELWAPRMGTALIDLYLPDLITVSNTLSHTTASPYVPSVLALASGNFIVTNEPVGSTPASLSFLRPDRSQIVFTQAPNGMVLNPDGTISRPDLVVPLSLLQLPNGQVLISDAYTNKIFRINEDGSFAEALTLPGYVPYGMALDRQGRLLVTTNANTLQVITFGQ